jgi:hypothetical protein
MACQPTAQKSEAFIQIFPLELIIKNYKPQNISEFKNTVQQLSSAPSNVHV